jgi:hypothetical protein
MKLFKCLFYDYKDIFKIYQADHTYTTLKMTMDASAAKIMKAASEKNGITNNKGYTLCELRSSGGKYALKYQFS